MLKCIECEGIAEYIYKGNSLCKEHLEYASKNGKVFEAEYFSLLKDFKGRERVLNYFWSKCEAKYNNFSFQNKCKWLRRVNKVMLDNNISEKVISDVLNLVIKKEIFDIGVLIKIMQSNQAKIDKQASEENRYDDVYTQIAKNA